MTDFPIVFAIPPRNPTLSRRSLEDLSVLHRWLEPHHMYVAFSNTQAEQAQKEMNEIGLDGQGVSLTPVHGQEDAFASDCLNALRLSTANLLILFREDVKADEMLPSWQRSIMEEAGIPILLLPVSHALEFPPFSSLLVPMSGEIRWNRALELGLRIASSRNLPVDIVHVAPSGEACCCGETRLEGLQEEFQHEYPQLIEEFIAQGSPLSDVRQKRQIREFSHRCGNAGDEIAKKLKSVPKMLLLAEWKGTLGPGRARILKMLCETGDSPMLFVREAREAQLKLKVGKDFPEREATVKA